MRDLQSRKMRVGLGPCKGKDSATTLGPWLGSGTCATAAASPSCGAGPAPRTPHARRRRHPHGRGDRRRLEHCRPRAGARPAAARPQTGTGTSVNRPISGNADAVPGARGPPLTEMAVNLTKRFSDALCAAGAANAYGIP
nr:hypothetical protein [Actinomadura geliboluensis]